MSKGISASRLHQVLAKLCPLRRRLAGQRVRKVSGKPHPIEAPETKVGSNDHPSGYGIHIYDPMAESPRELWPYEQAHPKAERHLYGPFPAHTSWADGSEQDISPAGQYRPCTSPVPGPTLNINININDADAIPCVPSLARPYSSERQVRRFGQTPALSIVPPTTSIPLAWSEYSANSACLPFSPYDYYSPNPASAVPPSLPYDDVLPDPIRGLQSPHSSKPSQSTQQPCSPISLRSNGPAPSMSRSSSSGRTESHSPPPSTPTHPQASRPTPPRDAFPHGYDSSVIWPTTTRPIRTIQQDPLLHISGPPGHHQYQHHHSPAAPQQQQAHRQHGWDLPLRRRLSDDSLGSNFTVEEEEEQAARDLSAPGRERVGGRGDMVHIPQPPEKRFSFEYDP